MIQKSAKRLVEICPQCHREVDNSSARLVADRCGHSKCRICLLQEISGCLKCGGDKTDDRKPESIPPLTAPVRTSVIRSTLEYQSDQRDAGTSSIIQQTLKPNILFPTDIVKRSTGNFFHLKRLISERYYSEGGGKEDKSCETDPPAGPDELTEQLPSHIVHFCEVHRKVLTDESTIESHKNCKKQVEVELSCMECNKRFANAGKLRKHLRVHTSIVKYQCQICMKGFKDNYALNTHQRIHTGQKAFTCTICNIQLKQLWSLKRHIAVHKGDKKFSCSQCDFKFITKNELLRHQASHSKSKTFTCNACGSKFTCHRSLVRHMVGHNTKHLLQCAHCEASFKRKDNLIRHVKNNHIVSD